MNDELSDGALIANYERNGGVVVLESGNYTRLKNESPQQFFKSVRNTHYAWESRQKAKENIEAKHRVLSDSEQYSSDSGPNRAFLQDALQAGEVDMETTIKGQVDRARRELSNTESQLNDALDLVTKLQAKINRLMRAVTIGEQVLEELRTTDVPSENAS